MYPYFNLFLPKKENNLILPEKEILNSMGESYFTKKRNFELYERIQWFINLI